MSHKKFVYLNELNQNPESSLALGLVQLVMETEVKSDLMSKYDISPFPDQTREELEREVAETLLMLEKYKK